MSGGSSFTKPIKVTGVRDFGTGAQRDPNNDKGRYDLLSPLFLRRLAVHTQKGGQARGDRNWEAGMPMAAVLDSAIRHLFNYLEGDRSEDHLAAAAWNVMNLIHHEEAIERGILPAELNNLPDYTKEEEPEEWSVGYCKNHGEYDTLQHENCPGCLQERDELLRLMNNVHNVSTICSTT